MPLHAPLRRHPAMRRSKSMRRLRGPMSVEDQFAEIRREKDYMFVGVGFSDLGYQNVAALHESFKRDIKPIIEKHGVKKVGFLAGATEPGVGALYQLAKQMGLDTYGLVSDSALHDSVPVSPYCDRVIFVRRKFPYDWAVKDANDRSHTVNAAVLGGAQGGGVYAYGGGDVGTDESLEAQRRGVPLTVYPQMAPIPENVRARQAKKPGFQPMPLIAAFDLDDEKKPRGVERYAMNQPTE